MTAPVWGEGFVYDGEVVYQQVMTSQAGAYDLNEASARGWRMKAGRAASMTSTTSAGQSAQLDRVKSACMEMAASYQQQGVA